MTLSLALAAAPVTNGDVAVAAWAMVILAYTAFRSWRPIRYVDDLVSFAAVLLEVALMVGAIVSTGYWDSPYAFSLIAAVTVAGFSRGFGFALQIGASSIIMVTVPELVRAEGIDARDAQLMAVVMMVGIVAGYARRISGEANRQHTMALDRLGRLADANALLFSLHRVAQALPASLDLDEVLDSTVSRLRDLFDFDVVALLLFDDTDGTWAIARLGGTRLPTKLEATQLPIPVARAVEQRALLHVSDLNGPSGPGLAPQMLSGVYAVLPARGSVIGVMAMEHHERDHFRQRDVELLNGFAEPAALAVDNARWFSRLRTVGAEEERTRIARDLHDRIGQSLAYLAFELDRIIRSDVQGRPVGESLGRLRDDVRGVVGEVRDTLYDLRTDVSETQDLATVLKAFLDRVRERSGMKVTLRAEQSGRLPLLQEREMFRITQEAIVNVERHAKASTVTVNWWCDGEAARLEIADDGAGFAVGRAGRLDSYGILGMRERAASIGATLDVVSERGAGSKVECTVGERRRLTPFRVRRATPGGPVGA